MSEPVLKGRKVTLRPWDELLTEEYLRIVYRWNQDTEVMYWMGVPPVSLPFEEFAGRMRRFSSRNAGRNITYGVLDEAGTLIGRITCYNIDRKSGEGEIGILIGEKALWGRGYGSDALCTFVDYLFRRKGFRKLRARTFWDNTRALRCFTRCGFRIRGRVTLHMETGVFQGLALELTAREFYTHVKPRQEQGKPPKRVTDGR